MFGGKIRATCEQRYHKFFSFNDKNEALYDGKETDENTTNSGIFLHVVALGIGAHDSQGCILRTV